MLRFVQDACRAALDGTPAPSLLPVLIDNVATTYSTGVGNTILYRVIRDYTTDGVNLQIVWTCAMPGSATPWSTFVSQNLEAYPLAPRSSDRRPPREQRRWRGGASVCETAGAVG